MIAVRLCSVFNCLSLAIWPLGAVAESNAVALVENAAQIGEIVQYYQTQCDEEQASVLPEIDEDDRDKHEKGVLTLAPDSIYDIQITPTGKQATALVPQFHCSNIGHASPFLTHLARRFSRNSCSNLQLAQEVRC